MPVEVQIGQPQRRRIKLVHEGPVYHSQAHHMFEPGEILIQDAARDHPDTHAKIKKWVEIDGHNREIEPRPAGREDPVEGFDFDPAPATIMPESPGMSAVRSTVDEIVNQIDETYKSAFALRAYAQKAYNMTVSNTTTKEEALAWIRQVETSKQRG